VSEALEPLSHSERLALSVLVNLQHLSTQAIASVRAAMDAHSNRHAVIDEFLAPQHLGPLRELVTSEGHFDRNLKVTVKGESVAHLSEAERRGRVDAELFESIPDKDRFISQEIYAASDSEDSKAAKTDRLVRKMMHSAPMHRLLSAMSGHELSATAPINLKRHGPGHFLRRHSDATGGRKLCSVLYLHDEWEPQYGGRFILYAEDGSEIAVDPLPNRLVIFDVTVKNDHAIEELASVPEGWWRSNYSIWFL
jgi:Rps23 Pro-64 3,4-dihydroxylase Tpa1-like proline 4-hydroxylase